MVTSANDSNLSVNTGSDSYTQNYIEESNEPSGIGGGCYYQKTAGNLGPNSVTAGNAVVDTSTSYMGLKSIKIENEENKHNSTVVYHTLPAGDLAGKNITLSSYVKINHSERIYNDFSYGASLSLRCYGSAGDTNAIALGNSVSIAKTVNGWDRISASVKVPSKAEKISIELCLKNTYGTAWFDCIQLEEGKVMNDYNALYNGDFSTADKWKTQDGNSISFVDNKVEIDGNGGEPAPIEETTSVEEPASAEEETTEEAASATYVKTETETVANDVIEATDSYGNVIKSEQGYVTRTYKRTYESAEPAEASSDSDSSDETESEETTEAVNCDKYIYQEVDVNKSDVSFVLSGSAKAKSVPLNSEYRTFGIALKIKYDGDSGYSEDHYQEFNAYTDSMQSVNLSVTPNDSEKIVEKVAFAFVYGYNKNKMTVKNAMLGFAYNGVEADSEPEATEPETTSAAEETTEPETAEEESSDENLVDEEIKSESINTEKEYMRTQTSYDTKGNYVVSEIDEAGNTTSYTRDGDGNATKITDGNNNTTSYSYDVHSNLLSVTGGNSSNTYTYNAYDELSKISHNGFDYNYTYDNFGAPTSVKVGSKALITYTYNSIGNVTKAAYGNGDYLDYIYDEYARLTEVKLNNTATLASYVYNKKGQLTKFVDGKSGETTEYCYDCNGNALYKYLISSDGDLLRVVDGDTEKTSINGSMRTITNGTDDNGKSYVQNGKAKITSDSDDFGRASKVTTEVDDSPKYSVNYTYKNIENSNQTTNNIKSITYNLGSDNEVFKYSYSYDSNSNVTTVHENDSKVMQFTYDSLNQLKTSADKNSERYNIYTYDNSGNITKKQEYTLHLGGWHPTTLLNTVNYKYENSSWGDMLTEYDGQALTYDEIGNPTSYRDGMTMTWSGRELQGINKENKTYSFTYNLNGLRTKKNSNGTIVNYYYDDSNNLIGLKKGTATVLFYYDSEGKVCSMTKGDDTYFFIKNLQGDVTKIIDENGETCATYAYDAWGALLTQNEDSSVEGLNPFRYRGYVYDLETELYYLQSRYYDPKTGRFINADDSDYTDTYSGSPLSTNMFAYCENNAISGYDPTGNWDKSDHKDITKNAGFSKVTYQATVLADKYFPSDGRYSSPFHSRKGEHSPQRNLMSSLNIAVEAYNLAVMLYKQYGKGETSLVKFHYSNSSKKGVKLDYRYFAMLNKKTKKYDTNEDRSKVLLMYLNGKYNAKLKKDGFKSIKNRKDQADALLGLALHTLQDHFAHLTMIEVYYNGKFLYGKPITTTGFSTSHYVKSTAAFEDNIHILSWRYKNTKKITRTIYKLYYSKKEIFSIYEKRYGKLNSMLFIWNRDCYTILYRKYRLKVCEV